MARTTSADPTPAESAVREDDSVVQRIREGDRSVFSELVRKHRPSIVALMLRYTKNPSEAEDLTQQTFLRALRAMGDFRGDSSFHTWLHRIAVNLALNRTRASGRTSSVPLEEEDLITNTLGTARVVAREAQQRLHAAVVQLPPMQRAVVELRIVHELAFAGIGEIVGTSEDSAKANYQHAVKRLREWIGE